LIKYRVHQPKLLIEASYLLLLCPCGTEKLRAHFEHLDINQFVGIYSFNYLEHLDIKTICGNLFISDTSIKITSFLFCCINAELSIEDIFWYYVLVPAGEPCTVIHQKRLHIGIDKQYLSTRTCCCYD